MKTYHTSPLSAENYISASPSTPCVVDRQLVRYVRDQLKKRYSVQAIRGVLLRSGYTHDEIILAIKLARWEPVVLITLVVLAVAGVVGVGMYFFVGPEHEFSNQQHIEIAIELNTEKIVAGGSLPYHLIIKGLESPVQMKVRHSLLKGVEEITSENDLIFTLNQHSGEVNIPNNLLTGVYKLVISVLIDNREFTAQTQFEVIENMGIVRVYENKSTPNLDTQVQPDVDDIIILASEAPERAETLCNDLTQPAADRCFLESGLSVSDPRFCKFISDNDKRDSCYFNLILAERDRSLCENIVDPRLRNTCERI
jgi:hypothetical protein